MEKNKYDGDDDEEEEEEEIDDISFPQENKSSNMMRIAE